jgi:hypothetical protein
VIGFNIPVLMLSGYPDDVPKEAVHLVDAFVTKGEAPERLLQGLAANLQGRSLGRITILNVDDNRSIVMQSLASCNMPDSM